MTDRETALAFMKALWAGDVETCGAMMSENATWHFQLGMPQAQLGRGRIWPAREALQRIVDDLFGKFDAEGFAVTPTRIVAENGAVAIEYEARGRTAKGADYRNFYATILSIADERVIEVCPYNDTAHMLDMLAT